MPEGDGELLHSAIHVICDECGVPDVLSVLEHPQDSQQFKMVAKAHHQMAEEHAKTTGHHVEVGETEDNPKAILEFARGMAPSVSGAAPEDFEEVSADV